MATPFNVPEEFIQGMAKASHTLVHLARSQALPTSELHAQYWRRQFGLWSELLGQAEPVIAPERGDRRFQAAEWQDQAWFRLLKQLYLLNSQLVVDLVDETDLDAKEKHKLRFFARQIIDAASPANFAATNPEALKAALDSGGESLRNGFANWLSDLGRGRVSITDEGAFEIGVNVATSAGEVVFENEVMQIIQYAPLTASVAQRPLLIVPPCINKFYILDLQPENSFVRYACEQGMTVFLVSWRNPGPEQSHLAWDDYAEQGAMRAIEVARAIGGSDRVNVLGWCVGGTILSSALAVLRTRGEDSVASLTLLTTMLDFTEPGDLGVFIHEMGVRQREAAIGGGGLYNGAELGFVFQTLRANDLLWPYVVDNYLKGKSPPAFDLLYWNADSTNLPGPMYAWYLRHMYLQNDLCVPGRLMMCGTPVDLGRVDVPSYVMAAQEDHIVPWQSAYRTTQLLGGKTQFVLGASGHIAGVINPASKNKRQYWSGGPPGESAQDWLASASATPGSWWPHWAAWLRKHAGKAVPARKKLGSTKHKPIEPAPGRYVKVRAG